MFANLSKKQMISIGIGVVVIILLVVYFSSNNDKKEKEKYEDMVKVLNDKEQQIKEIKEINNKVPENQRMKDDIVVTKNLSYTMPGSHLFDNLYTMIHNVKPLQISVEGKFFVDVNAVYHDDLDVWFIATDYSDKNKAITYILTFNPVYGIQQQYKYGGSWDDFEKLNPSNLVGYKKPGMLALINPTNPMEPMGDYARMLFNKYAHPMVPEILEEDRKMIYSKTNVNPDILIKALLSNEVEFRKMIRNSRLQLREIESRNGMMSDSDKAKMVATTMVEFMTRKDIVNNFNVAVTALSGFNFDTFSKMNPVNCKVFENIRMNDDQMMYLGAINTILLTYREMLNRLFGSIMVNFNAYSKYCTKNPELVSKFNQIFDSLKYIISNKEFLDQVCPKQECPTPVCPTQECPKQECPACSKEEMKQIPTPIYNPTERTSITGCNWPCSDYNNNCKIINNRGDGSCEWSYTSRIGEQIEKKEMKQLPLSYINLKFSIMTGKKILDAQGIYDRNNNNIYIFAQDKDIVRVVTLYKNGKQYNSDWKGIFNKEKPQNIIANSKQTFTIYNVLLDGKIVSVENIYKRL